jgi:hypothetical protein
VCELSSPLVPRFHRTWLSAAKFFEAKYRERQSGNDLIAKLFPELGEEVTDRVEAPTSKSRSRSRIALPILATSSR